MCKHFRIYFCNSLHYIVIYSLLYFPTLLLLFTKLTFCLNFKYICDSITSGKPRPIDQAVTTACRTERDRKMMCLSSQYLNLFWVKFLNQIRFSYPFDLTSWVDSTLRPNCVAGHTK